MRKDFLEDKNESYVVAGILLGLFFYAYLMAIYGFDEKGFGSP